MMMLLLLTALVLILGAAEMFTNSLEHLGVRLRISEGATGRCIRRPAKNGNPYEYQHEYPIHFA